MNRPLSTTLELPSSQRYEVLGVSLCALQIPELIQQMEHWIHTRRFPHCITFANVHVVVEALHDRFFYSALHGQNMLNVPDGKPLIWLARLYGFKLDRRVYGPDLMHDFIERTAGKGYRHFFYGGAPGVPEQLASVLIKSFPGLSVVGTYSPPFRPLSPAEDLQVVEMINAARPDVLWVGLGCPKQEKWSFEHRSRLEVPVLAAVGQAFDIHARVVQQAPLWMREHGLEWLFRLAHEPRRLWKRYLFYNSEFLWCVFLELLGVKHYS